MSGARPAFALKESLPNSCLGGQVDRKLVISLRGFRNGRASGSLNEAGFAAVACDFLAVYCHLAGHARHDRHCKLHLLPTEQSL
jgi:hypothetical protein